MAYGQYSLQGTTLPQVILMDIGLACMQASPDPAHVARVQITARLEENRRKNLVLPVIFFEILTFSVLFPWLRPRGLPVKKH